MKWPVIVIVALAWLGSVAAAAVFAWRQPAPGPGAEGSRRAANADGLESEIAGLQARIAEIEADNRDVAGELQQAAPDPALDAAPVQAPGPEPEPPSVAELTPEERQRILDRNARILASLDHLEDLPGDGVISLISLLADVARTGEPGFEQLADFYEEEVLTGKAGDLDEPAMILTFAVMGYPHERSLAILSGILESPQRPGHWETEMGAAWAFHQVSRLPSADVRPYAAQLRELGAGAITRGQPGEDALAPIAALAFVHEDAASLSLMRHSAVREQGAGDALRLADYLHTPAARNWIEDVALTHKDPAVRERAEGVIADW